MTSALVALRGVGFDHGDGNPVLTDIDLVVESGQRVAVVGANGSGKSTLARLVIGELEPTTGVIEGTLERPAQVATAADLRLHRERLVGEVIAGAGRDRGQVHRALEAVGLGADLANRRVADMSGGERYRVAVAAAIAKELPLMVLDAPTAVLDARASRGLVRALSGRRGALLVFSADLTLAVESCDRALVLAEGRIVAQGPPNVVLTDTEMLAEYGVSLPSATSPSWLRRRARQNADASIASRSRLQARWRRRGVEHDDLATEIATRVAQAFANYRADFSGITRRAARRFAQREWRQHQLDASERLELHRRCVVDCVGAVEPLVARLPEVDRRRLWVEARQTFAQAIAWQPDSELAETFFNSVSRRVFTMVGTDDDLEFRWFGGIILPVVDPGQGEVATFRRRGTTTELVAAVLSSFDLRAAWADLDADSVLAGQLVDRHLAETWETAMPVEVDMLTPVFYRNRGAYLVGRIRHLNRVTPLVFALRHGEAGVSVDAVLLSEHLTSRIFGFTRSYFHVDTQETAAVVAFVKSLLPTKPVAELYTAIGQTGHGKTQLFRGLYRHLENSTDRFQLARGVKGLVMIVFTLPSFDVVFKVIKDTFPPSKRTSRDQVMGKYTLVFAHDRVGRMVDAQPFENVSFPRRRFADDLLEELAESAGRSVEITETDVVIKHVYTERRVYPLDLYLDEMPSAEVQAAALDYGEAVKDLASANIFPGDLFTKNFGVTRHGSVVFYDYDELALLSDCRFRHLPEAPTYDDEMLAEPWFPVGVDDIFPEEFAKFFRLPADSLEAFRAHHGDLCDPEYWQAMQARHESGQVPEFFPYPNESRLPDRPA